jgi:pyruvate/2-oxoglutarate/acetoin dehydrogenase E1 component
MLQNVPGLRVLLPGTPSDIDCALHAAMTGPDPTVILDHVLLADTRGSVPDEPSREPAVTLLRDGTDALLISASVMTPRALLAAEQLRRDGHDVAVLNVPVVAPVPLAEVMAAVAAHRLVIFVEESRGAGSPSSFLMASLLEQRRDMRAALLCSAPAPAPFAPHLLDEIVPTPSRIVAAVRDLIQGAEP